MHIKEYHHVFFKFANISAFVEEPVKWAVSTTSDQY